MGEGRRNNSRTRAFRANALGAARRLLPAALALVLIAAAAIPALAQFDVTAHGDISLTATESHFFAGECLSQNNTINWSAAANWQVSVRSLDADLGLSDDGFYTKPLSDLQWKRSSLSSWNTMTTSDVQVMTGAAGSSSFDVDYRFLLSWSQDSAGAYGATIQYTITAL